MLNEYSLHFHCDGSHKSSLFHWSLSGFTNCTEINEGEKKATLTDNRNACRFTKHCAMVCRMVSCDAELTRFGANRFKPPKQWALFFTRDILTYFCRKSTGVTNNINNGSVRSKCNSEPAWKQRSQEQFTHHAFYYLHLIFLLCTSACPLRKTPVGVILSLRLSYNISQGWPKPLRGPKQNLIWGPALLLIRLTIV